MRGAVNHIVLVWSAVTLLVALPVGSRAQDSSAEDREAGASGDRGARSEPGWTASIAATGGVLLQQQKAEIENDLDGDPAMTFRPRSQSGDLALTAFVGGSLEVMTPALPLPARPRIFLGGEILPNFSTGRDVTKDGDPDACAMIPEGANPPCIADVMMIPTTPLEDEFDFVGQGSKVRSEFQTLAFGGYLGVAFPLEIAGRPIRIKPSLAWLLYQVETRGELVAPVCTPNPTPQNPGGVKCFPGLMDPPGTDVRRFVREVNLRSNESRFFNAIGPGLDIEMETGRIGPLGTSIFLGGRAYRTLGDRTIPLSASQSFPNDGRPLAGQTANARWELEVEEWMFRVGVGFRIHWLGFAK